MASATTAVVIVVVVVIVVEWVVSLQRGLYSTISAICILLYCVWKRANVNGSVCLVLVEMALIAVDSNNLFDILTNSRWDCGSSNAHPIHTQLKSAVIKKKFGSIYWLKSIERFLLHSENHYSLDWIISFNQFFCICEQMYALFLKLWTINTIIMIQ